MSSSHLNVLLIEDNLKDAESVRKSLVGNNGNTYQLRHATSLQEGLQYLAKETFSILLVDLQLPDSQGAATVERVQAHAAAIPLIVLTASEDEALPFQMLQQGAQDYLPKAYIQVYARLLERTIHYAIERKRLQEALRRSHEQLELRVRERTAELAKTNDSLRCEVAARKRTERRLTAQHAIASILALSPKLSKAVPNILQHIGEALEWDAGAIWTVDAEANVLHCIDFWHNPEVHVPDFEVITKKTRFPSGIGLPGRVWADGKPAWILDVPVDKNFPRGPLAKKNGLHGALGFPIMIEGKVFGVIEFFSREIQEPDIELLQMFAMVGIQLGQFMQRKQAEEKLRTTHDTLREAQTQLVQSEKLSVIGQLATGISHELKNPLAVISQGVTYLEGVLPPTDATAAEVAAAIKDAIRRANNIIGGLLDFAKPESLKLTPQHMNAVVEKSLKLAGSQISLEKIAITKELASDQVRVLIDEERMQQVLINLIVNAVQAMPQGGQLTLRSFVSEARLGQEGVGRRADDHFQPGDQIMVCEVQDTGIGISADKVDKIFTPFFTTKPKGEGTGLGLSIVRSIVESHQGCITIKSEKGRGTSLRLYCLFAQIEPAELPCKKQS